MKQLTIVCNASFLAVMTLSLAGCGDGSSTAITNVTATTTTSTTAAKTSTTTATATTSTTAATTSTTAAATTSTTTAATTTSTTAATTTTTSTTTTTTAAAGVGKALFISNNCINCHAAWGTGSALFPLATTTEASLTTAISTQLAMSGYTYLTPAQKTAIVTFLQTGK